MLAAGLVGALMGFLAGAGFAVALSGQVFWYGFPTWVWHLLAITYGLALGLAGVFQYRGWLLKVLSLLGPPAFALLASWILLTTATQAGVPKYIWFGTMAALAGAASGLLAGFSSRSLGGFVAGMMAGQVIAWPAGHLFMSMLQTRMPYGLVVPMAFALACGLTHLAVALALRWAKADVVPPRKPIRATKSTG